MCEYVRDVCVNSFPIALATHHAHSGRDIAIRAVALGAWEGRGGQDTARWSPSLQQLPVGRWQHPWQQAEGILSEPSLCRRVVVVPRRMNGAACGQPCGMGWSVVLKHTTRCLLQAPVPKKVTVPRCGDRPTIGPASRAEQLRPPSVRGFTLTRSAFALAHPPPNPISQEPKKQSRRPYRNACCQTKTCLAVGWWPTALHRPPIAQGLN